MIESTKQTSLWVINQFASTPRYSSGAGERFYYLTPFFQESGFNIKVFSGGYNHLFLDYPATPLLFNREDIKGGEMVWIKMRRYSGENFIGRFLLWFEFLFKLFRFRFKKRHTRYSISFLNVDFLGFLCTLPEKKVWHKSCSRSARYMVFNTNGVGWLFTDQSVYTNDVLSRRRTGKDTMQNWHLAQKLNTL